MKKVQFNEIVEQVPELNHYQRLPLRKEIEHCSDLKEAYWKAVSRITLIAPTAKVVILLNTASVTI